MTVANVYAILQENAVKHGDRAAIEFKNHTLSFKQLKEASDRLAAGLNGLHQK